MIISRFIAGIGWLPPGLVLSLTSLVAFLLIIAFVRLFASIVDAVLKFKDMLTFWRK